ncbi:MAG: ribonucleoside reductase class II [Elusimicrobia bacterium]|nr:ribonucleoside reductase class II [Elusimicrobiota bacterium]
MSRINFKKRQEQSEGIALTENQLKVIRDKYLRDSKSVEEWLRGIARNLALAELFHHPRFEQWGALEGVACRVVETETKPGLPKTKTWMFHAGMHQANERDKNFVKFMANLYKIYNEVPEAKELVTEWEDRFYDLMAKFEFLPNSPTLMNAGRELQQLSACYVLPVPDSMEGITYALQAQALIQKSGGGTGFSFGRLRPAGDTVKSTKGIASGSISFMQLFDKMTDVVKQGGTRRGANMGILPYWHPEIKEFITMKNTPKVMENFNVSVAVDKTFFDAVVNDKEIDQLNPRSKEPIKKIRAREIFDLIVENAWKTGDPGLFIIDRTNESASNPVPHKYTIESTNPCFAGDMRLATDKGLLTFEELHIEQDPISVATDNRVSSIDGTSSGGSVAVKVRAKTGITLRKAVPVYKTRKNWPVFKIVTSHGYEVTATEDHKFFTPSGRKAMKDLKPGDEILIQSGRGVWSENNTLPPFTAEDKLRARINRGECRLPKQWSRELGEFLGWVTGDGYVSAEKPKGRNVPNYTIGLMFGNDEKKILAPKFQKMVKEWVGLDGNVTEWQTGAITVFYKSALYYFLKSLGLSDADGLNKTVPSALWSAPREAVLGFLRALFSADGTVNISKKIHYGSIRLANSSKKLLQEVQVLLLNEGIVSQLYLRRKAGAKMMPGSDRKPKLYHFADQYELVITRENRAKFLRQIGFLLPAKQRKAELWEKSLTKGAHAETYITSVKNIEPAGTRDVFCTTEEETHSLIANGFVAGNCGEKPLFPWEPCNLGSISLARFVKGPAMRGEIDWDRLEKAVKLSIRFLDDVIEVNNYPLPEIEEMAKTLRRIGLGVMGWAEMLVGLGIPYDSEEAVETAREVMGFINKKSLEASEEIAKERGAFQLWAESVYNPQAPTYRGKEEVARNCVRTTIAPTGTIGIAAGLQGGGIEPFFAVAYTRYNAKALDAIRKGMNPDNNDVFVEVNPLFAQVARENDYFGLSKDELFRKIDGNHKSVRGIPEIPAEIQAVFATAHDVNPEYHVKMQAAYQEFTDDGVSKTVNMPNSATVEDIRSAYLKAYELGCKGITIYRDGCKADQVLNLNPLDAKKRTEAQRRDAPFGVSSEYYVVKTGYGTLHVHIDYDENGPFQVFTNLPPLGTEISGLTSIMGILLSKYLEAGGDPVRILKHLNSVKGDRPFGIGDNRIDSIPHAVAVALKAHLKKIEKMNAGTGGNGMNGATKPAPRPQPKGNVPPVNGGEEGLELWEVSKAVYCPKCFSPNVSYQSGCKGPTCHECGYSECS